MTMQIRKGNPDDIDWILSELKKFSEFFGTKKSLFGDGEYARQGFLGVIKDHVVFMAEKDSEPVGFIAGLLTAHLFNPSIKILTELFWWVSEEYRRSRAGALLMQAFIEYGKQNSNWIAFTLETKSSVNESTLLKRGFHLHERSYLREV